MKKLAVLGATGSIGTSTLALVEAHPDKYEVISLSAYKNVEALLALCHKFKPKCVVMIEQEARERLRFSLSEQGLSEIAVLTGSAALDEICECPETDLVVAGIVGAAGLGSVLAAAKAGKTILLANKEPLVMTGRLLMDLIAQNGAKLLPVDSEHNALFQCMPSGYETGERPKGVRRLHLTASGGPFRTRNSLEEVTVEAALAHPNWSMGPKISVDSATMMNKGLEVIEAHILFDMPAEDIEVLVHPQSVVHSLVEYQDGSFLAQLGPADMRVPIAHCLAWPERIESQVPSLDLLALKRLDFEPVCDQKFPCVRMAYEALRAGGTAMTTLNASNEVAVAAFLRGQIAFTQIASIVESTLNKIPVARAENLAQILDCDKTARAFAQMQVNTIGVCA